MLTPIATEFAEKIILALLIGSLIGLERSHSKQQEIIGLRTFALVTLLGCLLGILSDPGYFGMSDLPMIGFVAIGILSIILYVSNVYRFKEIGMTTAVAILLSYTLGVIFSMGREHYTEAIFIAVIMTIILFSKDRLHRMVNKISHKEMLDLLEFMILVGIIYPFLPLEPIKFFIVTIELQTLWMLIVLISVMNLVGFIGCRLLSAKRSMEFIGLLGGLISQKVSCASLGDAYKKTKNADLIAGSLLMSNGSLLIRNLVILGLFVPSVVTKVILPVLVGFLMLELFGYLKIRKSEKAVLKIESPFNVKSAVKLSLKLFMIIILIELLVRYLPGMFLATMFIGGLLSGASTIASLSIITKSSPGLIQENMIVIGFGLILASELLFGAIPILWLKKSTKVVEKAFPYFLITTIVIGALTLMCLQ